MPRCDYKKGNIQFVNPYNFIPLGREPKRQNNAEDGNTETLHTGYFDCSLKTATPLAVPDVNRNDPETVIIEKKKIKHNRYPAYLQNGVLTIPGSSLRGSIRSVYETLTNSCMVTMDPEEQITKRSDLGTFIPCVLIRKENQWELYKAERIALVGTEANGYEHLEGNHSKFQICASKREKVLTDTYGKELLYGDEVSISVKPEGHEKRNKKTGEMREVWNNRSVGEIRKGNNTGCYLYLGEQISNKHAESIFRILPGPEKYTDNNIRAALEGLEFTLTMYRSESINRNLKSDKKKEKHYGYPGYERARNKGVLPLWYKEKNGHLYLSLAAIGRIAFETPMKDLSRNHQPCIDRKSLCPACAVFGMVGKDDGKGLGSRIRVTDAVWRSGEGAEENYCALKELGTPRTSYLPFYSKDRKEYDEQGAEIRGRKYYWHIPAVKDDSSIYSTKDKTERNSSIKLIRPENCFKFRVYYEDLTGEQVKNLAWVLTLGGNDSPYMHKIGHGKSLGLGSVKIRIEKQYERSTEGDCGYTLQEVCISDEGKPEGILDDAWNTMKIISKFDSHKQEKICYPFVACAEKYKKDLKDNDWASHKWFSNFKGNENPQSSNVLPSVEEAKEKLFWNLEVSR